MTRLRIREAVAGDDSRIGELLVDAFVSSYAREMPHVVVNDSRKRDLRDVAGKRAAGLVLAAETFDGKVVGSVTVYGPGNPESKAWLEGYADLRYLGIDLGHRGQGVADALLDEVFARARRAGWRGISLHVRRGAHGVGRLYERRGFRRDAAGDRHLPEIDLDGYATDALI